MAGLTGGWEDEYSDEDWSLFESCPEEPEAAALPGHFWAELEALERAERDRAVSDPDWRHAA